MNIKNALINGEIKNLVIEDGVIKKITTDPIDADIDASGRRVIPGMCDVHIHGWGGADTMDGDLSKLKKNLAAVGTTSFLPTTMTASLEVLERVTSASLDGDGADAIGFHLEGPFLSEKKCGAQDKNLIVPANLEGFKKLKNAKMMTVAPEIEGNLDFIKEVSEMGVSVAIGHTDCDYDTAIKAIECGADNLSHTFNAMPPLLHRDPGPIGAGLVKGIYAQLICDGFHVHRAAVLALFKMYGEDKIVLVSDALSCAGLPDGEYTSGGLPIKLQNGVAKLFSGVLAGSSTSLFNCVKKATEFGIPFDTAVKMASENPARLLGVKKGKIEEGYDADLLILSDDLEIQNVIVGGKLFK
jgi:N-acetylglucosamine-6-phosphate deacetylase